MNIRFFLAKIGLLAFPVIMISGNTPITYYSVNDFENVPKIDAHFHYMTQNSKYLEIASAMNFRLISPNTDSGHSIEKQMEFTSSILSHNRDKFAFFGTFSVDSFNTPDFADKTIARIKDCIRAGATGIKIWKNIGMVLKDKNGRFVMIDDPAFDPVFNYLEQHKIPVMGHLGEPKDCWLPEEKMTDPSDVKYYRNNPRYYMYLHPEVPSYEDQINARDNVLKKHPDLDFIGAHLGSLEWSVDELAKRLDMFPKLKVDMAARIYHLQYQSGIDREKVRNFMIKYQDRILYGTDNAVYDALGTNYDAITNNFRRGWMSHWIYLATDSTVNVKGLKLPKVVIDKIYFKNAESYFNLKLR